MSERDFEWDPEKARSNLAKHRIAFEDAIGAFGDPFGIDDADDRFDYGEERRTRLGLSRGRLLKVAYTIRGGVIRIISVRKADRNEQRRYGSIQG